MPDAIRPSVPYCSLVWSTLLTQVYEGEKTVGLVEFGEGSDFGKIPVFRQVRGN
jgi:hypothetical protein